MAGEADVNRQRALVGINLILRHLIEDESESSSSDEELDILERFLPDALRVRRRRKVPRLENYVEEVMPLWTDNDFKSHFRMSRATFEYVLGVIGNRLARNQPGRAMISPEKQFLIALWRMATPDSYRSVCEKFNVSRSTALLSVRRVTRALVTLAPALIRWPRQERCQTIAQEFEAISAFPKVIGAIGGTHIHIPAPIVNPEAYLNRKSYHSIQLQGVCDHKARFINCSIGHAGSLPNQRVFCLSEVQDFLGDDNKFPADCHLVGDSAYELHKNLMVPYRDNGHLSQRQKHFNFCLSSARIAIERAFGQLKGRFRSLLHCLPMIDTAEVPDFILACCVLHNICILMGDEVDECLTAEPLEEGADVPNLAEGAGQAAVQGAANVKRDAICAQLILRDV
ncbi:Protein ANTAGONIST OF LIKE HETEROCHROMATIN PROTEIN 1 [Frankliniella fusca]|uniref:Putative nuclease HARBI1 n=1 Tax=Frankliniella fusca TaxID=407009 RepID=A0AAE1HSM2_9NEOP|nr:Protein ANTAGONIST OF LIKE HETEROCHROMATIN PROTEIN 1 [Frankliniella fusca]